MGKQVHFKCRDYVWDGVELIGYKPAQGNADTFKNVSRQNIFMHDEDMDFDSRYFECGKDGFTTLEKHEHVHVVVVMRGKGKVIVGQKVHDVSDHDLIVIPSWAEHQLINTGDEPFGFICTVNAKRDPFGLLTRDEMDELLKNEEIKNCAKVPAGYFN